MSVSRDGLFSEYLMEKQGIETYFSQSGFISFTMNEDHIHIHEIFVGKEDRKKGAGRYLLDHVKQIARDNDYKHITCNCQLHHADAEFSLMRILETDFKLIKEPRELNFIMEVH